MRKQLESWFKNGTIYQDGVILYDQYGESDTLKRLFKSGESQFSRQKLIQVLTELLASSADKPEIPEIPIIPVDRSTAADKYLEDSREASSQLLEAIGLNINPGLVGVLADAPADHEPVKSPELLKVIKERNQVYAELRALHPYLSIMEDGEDLRQLAERIKALGRRNAELWTRYQYLVDHGEDPAIREPVKVPVMVDLNLINKRENIRKNLSRALKRKEGQAKPNKKTDELIAKHRADMAALDEKIAQIKAGVTK